MGCHRHSRLGSPSWVYKKSTRKNRKGNALVRIRGGECSQTGMGSWKAGQIYAPDPSRAHRSCCGEVFDTGCVDVVGLTSSSTSPSTASCGKGTLETNELRIGGQVVLIPGLKWAFHRANGSDLRVSSSRSVKEEFSGMDGGQTFAGNTQLGIYISGGE